MDLARACARPNKRPFVVAVRFPHLTIAWFISALRSPWVRHAIGASLTPNRRPVRDWPCRIRSSPPGGFGFKRQRRRPLDEIRISHFPAMVTVGTPISGDARPIALSRRKPRTNSQRACHTFKMPAGNRAFNAWPRYREMNSFVGERGRRLRIEALASQKLVVGNRALAEGLQTELRFAPFQRTSF